MKSFFPVIEWLSNYKRSYLKGDLFAGLTVGVMLIPQGMAYALIAGLPPVYGLYASIVPQIIYAIFGTSRQLSVAPVAMDSLLVAAGVSIIAVEGTEVYIAYAILLAFFMGAFQVLLGIFRLGFITNLLSKPVISGFTFAAALIIGINQLKYLLGVDIEKSNHIHEVVTNVFFRMPETHIVTVLIGIAGILIIIGLKKFYNKIPGSLLAVIFGTTIVYVFHLDQVGVAIVKEIPNGLPRFSLPDLTLSKWIELVPLAMTISVVAFMESFSVSKAIEAQKKDHKVRPNQELISLGMANVVGSFFQSYPVAGGFSRSAVNTQSGARTPLASIISAALVALTLVFLTPLFYYLPETILASVIMVAVIGLVDLSYVRQLWKNNKIEFGLLLATLLSTLIFSMVMGIVTGIVISILVLLYRSAYPHIAKLGRVKGHYEFRNIERFKELDVWNNLLILRVDAPLTFVNIQYFRDYIDTELNKSKSKIDTIVLDAGPVSYMDATATEGFRDLLSMLEKRNVRLLLSEVVGPVRDILHKTGLMDYLGSESIFLNLNGAVESVVSEGGKRYEEYAFQHE